MRQMSPGDDPVALSPSATLTLDLASNTYPKTPKSHTVSLSKIKADLVKVDRCGAWLKAGLRNSPQLEKTLWL